MKDIDGKQRGSDWPMKQCNVMECPEQDDYDDFDDFQAKIWLKALE